MRRGGWILAVFWVGCGGGGIGGPEILAIDRIEISPRDPHVSSGDQVSSVDFSATVYWNNGKTVTDAEVAWQSSNQVAGTLDQDGAFRPATENGGVTLITATYLGVTASTTLTVVFQRDILADGLPSALVDAYEKAPVVTDDARAPRMLYPYHGVAIPRNIPRFDVQWEPAKDRPLTILELSSATSLTRVFTTADRYVPDHETWQSIAATNSGGTVSLSARSAVLSGSGENLSLSGDVVAGSSPLDVVISRLDAVGSIYFWSSTAKGVEQIAYDAEQAVPFWDESVNGGNCVSCHALSPDGRRMAVGYKTSFGDGMGLLKLVEDQKPEEVITYQNAIEGARATFSSDGRYLVIANYGRFYLYNGETGAFIKNIDLGVEPVASPNFSPNDDELVFCVPNHWRTDFNFYNARIAAVPFHEGEFGSYFWVTPLVEGVNQYYPAYSPDGEWIAYNQSLGTDNFADEGDSFSDLSAELYLIRRGGGVPIRLDNVNDVAESLLGQPLEGTQPPPSGGKLWLSNSWPGWGPLPDANLLWLTFSSVRGFGYTARLGVPQIWVAGVDPGLAEAGLDPSYPPFWLPLQDPDEHNHIPQWGQF